jgi:hypothetical protein
VAEPQGGQNKMREFLKTKVSFKQQKENGEISINITTEDGFNKRVAAAKEDGKSDPELYKKQTFRVVEATTAQEAMDLCGGDEEIFLAHFNYGASLAQHNAANDLLTGEDFEPTEDTYDLESIVAQKPEGRAKLSPEEKAVRALAKGGISITADQLKAALAALTA